MPRNKKSEAKSATTDSSSVTATQSTAVADNAAGRGTRRGVQSVFEREQAQGFRGTEVDPTPNENYTVAGVTAGAPTPETDADAARDVRRETGLGLSPIEAADREKIARGEK